MTSPGREAMREHTLTPSTKKVKQKTVKNYNKRNNYSGQVITEEVEVTSRDGKKRVEKRERSIEDDIDSASDYARKQVEKQDSRRNRFEENKYEDANKDSEEYMDNSYDYQDAFNRMDRLTMEKSKTGADQGVLY